MALVTIEEVETRLGRCLEGADKDRVRALIADASAAIEGHIGYSIAAGARTDMACPVGLTMRLTYPNVAAVTSVTDHEGVDIPFAWVTGAQEITFPATRYGSPVTVAYLSGWAATPADLVAVACQVVGRAFGVSPDETGTTQESLGSYSHTIGSAAASGALGLLAAELAVCERYRRLTDGARGTMAGQIRLGNWVDRLQFAPDLNGSWT